MGWTAIVYTRRTNNIDFTKLDAFLFVKELAQKNKCQVLAFYFHKSTTKYDKHLCFCVFRNLSGNTFVNLIQLFLDTGELSYKEETNAEGPIFTNCPIEFLELLDRPISTIDRNWRMNVLKNNFRCSKKVVLSRFKLVLKFTDLTRYETLFIQEIDIRKYPEAINLKVGDRVGFGSYGILKQNDFFNSELYPFEYEKNLNLTLFIHRINTERILL